jgi:hypothetical protein
VPRTLVALLTLLPALAAALRVFGHPRSFFDREAAMTATIGRELGLHGLDLAFHYQVVPYQGALVLDACLAALGHRVLGDHLMAWHWVPLAWLTLAAVAGVICLRRAVGSAAIVWPLLLAAAPFLVKDGLAFGVGGHSAGVSFGLAALALAMGADRDTRRATVAGVVLGIGIWHIRTAAVATPAVALACWFAGGRAALLGLARGLCALPVLLVLNIAALKWGGTVWEARALRDLVPAVVFPGADEGERTLIERVGYGSGWSFAPLMFAQPPDAQGLVPVRGGAPWIGRLWVASWLAVPPLAAAVWWRGADRIQRRAAGVVALLAGGWIVAWQLAPVAVEAAVVELVEHPRVPAAAAPLNPMRYFAALYPCWILLLSLGLGAALHHRFARPAAGLVAAALIVTGGALAVEDWRFDRDLTSPTSSIWTAYYPSIMLEGRLPPRAVHLRSLGSDSDSRRFHLDALAWSLPCSLGRDEPGCVAGAVEELEDEADGRLRPDDLERIARYAGRRGAERAGEDPGRAAAAALAAADRLSDEAAAQFTMGAYEGLHPNAARPTAEGAVAALCEVAGPEAPPRCAP